MFGGQELLSDGLQGYETDVFLANCGTAKCSELSWCLPPRNNTKALKLQSAQVPLAPTQLPPCKTRDLLGGKGEVMENTKGNLHVSPKPRGQRLHRISYTPGAGVRGPSLNQQGLLGIGHNRHLVLHHGVIKSTVTPERSLGLVRVFLRKTQLDPSALRTYHHSCSQIPGPSMLLPPGQPPGSAGRPAVP